ncbi:hypothetical protein J2X69_001767 [Algoriphagus sp. 4150]|nr:hypothetical protein [Algoriphagus sp. 4150]MDR7129430.1 hypothetical protein [Algoriphagus sp. 4150]
MSSQKKAFLIKKNWTYDVGDHGWGNEELEYYSQNDLKNARIEICAGL